DFPACACSKFCGWSRLASPTAPFPFSSSGSVFNLHAPHRRRKCELHGSCCLLAACQDELLSRTAVLLQNVSDRLDQVLPNDHLWVENGFFHSFAFAQDLQQRRVFLAALRTHAKVMFHATKHIVQRKSGALLFDEFAHVLQAFGAIEFAVACLA